MTSRQPDYIVITASNPTQAGNYQALVNARVEAVRLPPTLRQPATLTCA